MQKNAVSPIPSLARRACMGAPWRERPSKPATQARDGRRHSIARGSTIRSWRRFARSARRCSQNAAGSRMSFFGGCVKGNDCRRQQGESLSMDRWRRQPRPRRHGRAHRPRRRECPSKPGAQAMGSPGLRRGLVCTDTSPERKRWDGSHPSPERKRWDLPSRRNSRSPGRSRS